MKQFATKLRSYLAGRTTMETGVVTPKSHRWRICPQSEASTTSNAARDSSVPSEMFQTTLSRLNARKLPTTPLPLMDKVVARFMNISPEQWERVNSAIEFLNDHFKDVFLSWLTIRWLVASHPEQFLPAPYNSYELLAHESETKLAIENAKKGAGRWRESYHGLQPETKAWQNKLNKVEAEMACLTLAANGGSAHNTAMARNTTVRRSEALQPGAMAVSKDCEIGPLHIPCRRPAKSQRSKGTATQRQESASGQVSTEAESDQCLFHKDIDTKQKKRLSTKPTQHPSTHDEQELSSKRFNHPIHNSAEQYTGDTNSFNVSNMRSNGSSSNTCTMTTTTKTTTTTSYATVSTNERKDRHSVSADSVGLNMQEGTGVQNGDDPAVMVEKPSTVQVLNRVQDILRCVRGVRSEDDRQTLPFVAPCGSGETDSARTSTSGPNVEVLYVQYNQQKGRRDRARDLSGLAANPPNASRSPMLCQQDRSVQKPSTKSSRTGGFSVTAVDRLLELKQTGSITEYANRFMNQFSKATDIPEAVAVGVFLENLLPDFRTLTVGKRPETLADAIRLAYQVEQAILEKQDRLPGCGDAFGVAIHLQDPPAVAGRCVQPGVGDTVDNSHSSRCDVDTSIRPRSQTARTHCQTSSGHYHNVSYHEAASLKELSEGVSPTGSSVCLNSNSSDEVMGDEETLRLPATSDSRTTPVMRRSTIGGGEGGNVAEATFNGLPDSRTPKARRNSKSSTSICSIQQLQHIVPGTYRGRTVVGVEQPTRSDEREITFSTNKQCHTSVVSSASAAPFASFKSSSCGTETQSEDSFVSSLGSSTESTQAVGNLRTAESFASVWRGNVSSSPDDCEDSQRSCRAESGEISDSGHQGGRQGTETRSPSPQGGTEALSTAHLPQKNSTVRKSFGSRVAFGKQKNEAE